VFGNVYLGRLCQVLWTNRRQNGQNVRRKDHF